MHNVITIIDNAFTHPWTVDKRYRRDRNVDMVRGLFQLEEP